MGIRIAIRNAVLSYPHLFETHSVAGGTAKYGTALILDEVENIEDLKTIQAAKNKLVEEELKGQQPARGIPVVRGVEKYPDQEKYKGKVIINAYSLDKPAAVDQWKNDILDKSILYPGCIVNAALDVYVYRNPSTGITFGLNGIQFVRDGDRLDSRPTVDDMFDDVEAEAAPAPVEGEAKDAFDWN